MAEVYRPKYTMTEPKTGKRVRRKSPTYHIRYYLPSGERVRVKGYRDRKATETYAAELERKAERLAAGIVDIAEEHARRPLEQHVVDFLRCLDAKQNVAAYAALTRFRLIALLDGCRFIKIGVECGIHTFSERREG